LAFDLILFRLLFQVDWNPTIDPELLLDLEREPKSHSDGDKDENVVILGYYLPLNQSVPCTVAQDGEMLKRTLEKGQI